MDNKNLLINKIIKIQNISNKYDINKNEFERLKQEIKEFKVTTPVIGGFSSGKSSLINAILDRKILSTSIQAETAIPTEISYGSENILKINSDGSIKNITFEDLKENDFSINETSVIKINLENEFLEKIKDVKIVDMPGFDSGIESHNKAIDNYLPSSLAYIITFEVGENIRESIADFLSELNFHNVPVLIVITKCDKATDEDVFETIKFMNENIPNYFTKESFKVVRSSSKRIINLDDVKNFLIEVQDKSDQILLKTYAPKINNLGSMVEKYINSRINNNKLSSSELKQKEEDLKRDLKNLIIKIDSEEESFKKQVQNCITNIKNKIRADLISSKSGLESMLLNGQDISQKVNVIVRNSVTSAIKSEFEPKLLKYFKNISRVLENCVDINPNIEMNEFSVNVDNVVKDVIKKSIPVIMASIGGILAGPIGAIIGGALAILVDVFFDKKQENEKRNQIERQISSDIIPNIVEQAGNSVETELLSYVDEVTEQIKENVTKEKEVLEKSLEDIKAKRQKQEEEQKNELLELEDDLKNLRGILSE